MDGATSDAAVEGFRAALGSVEQLEDLLAKMSCKAAVKAGDPLTTEEIKSLLELRDLCQDSHHCPHGRPSALVFSRDELDKRFQRTGI